MMKIIKKKVLEKESVAFLKSKKKANNLSKQISIAYFNKAVNCFRNKRYKDCLIELDCSIKYDMINIKFYLFKAIVLGLILGKIDAADEILDKALLIKPQSFEIQRIRKELRLLKFNNFKNNYFI